MVLPLSGLRMTMFVFALRTFKILRMYCCKKLQKKVLTVYKTRITIDNFTSSIRYSNVPNLKKAR